MINIKRVQDLTQEPAYQTGSLVLAIGGFSSTRQARADEEVTGSIPEWDDRPRTAIAHKDGKIYLITSRYGYSLPRFGEKMDGLGFNRSEWLFMDGGPSTQSYFYNNGYALYKHSSKSVPLLVGVKRGDYNAFVRDSMIVCEADPEDLYLLNKVTNTKEETGFDGINGTFYTQDQAGNYIILGVAYDRGQLIANGVAWRPPRACMLITKDQEEPAAPLTLEERIEELEERVGLLEREK